MKAPIWLAAAVAAGIMAWSGAALAFECPKRFADAQAAIDKVQGDMKGMAGQMSKEGMALVHALLDDAKMLLDSGKHNHEKPQGAYDHGRAVAKAMAAQGYARAAEVLHQHYMKQ